MKKNIANENTSSKSIKLFNPNELDEFFKTYEYTPPTRIKTAIFTIVRIPRLLIKLNFFGINLVFKPEVDTEILTPIRNPAAPAKIGHI
jgi:hypothetical protein